MALPDFTLYVFPGTTALSSNIAEVFPSGRRLKARSALATVRAPDLTHDSSLECKRRISSRVPSSKQCYTHSDLVDIISPSQAQSLMDRVKASGLDFPESSRLKKHLSAATDWINKANSALASSIQLRDLDKLLTEADKLAVDPGPKLDELQAKMDKARVWLEKVRKAVPRQRATRRNAPDVEAEKVSSSSGVSPLIGISSEHL